MCKEGYLPLGEHLFGILVSLSLSLSSLRAVDYIVGVLRWKEFSKFQNENHFC